MVIKRKRRVARRRKRKNPKAGTYRPVLKYSKRKGWSRPKSRSGKVRSRLMKKPTRVNPKRRRKLRRNPKLSVKSIISQQKLMQAATIGGGIILGATAMPLLMKVIPENMKQNRKYLGIVHVLAGLVLSSAVKNKNLKTMGMVVAGTGVYDLIAMNITSLNLPALPSSDVLVNMLPSSAAEEAAAASYTPGLSASYGASRMPVSKVAAIGMGASYSSGMSTVGLAGDDLYGSDPYEGIDW